MPTRLWHQPCDPWSPFQYSWHIRDTTNHVAFLDTLTMKAVTVVLLYALVIAIVRAAELKRGLNLGSSDYEQIDLPKYLFSPVLQWVYNYDPVPTKGESYGNLSYVPMLWGQNESAQFRTMILSGPRYQYLLSFNEPDMIRDVGGSNLSVENAAAIWQSQLQPLVKEGYKIGLPAGISPHTED